MTAMRRSPWRRFLSAVGSSLSPDQRLKLTREGRYYLLIWLVLLALGLQQQSNLVLLIAGLAAGPLVASVLLSGGMIKSLKLTRRTPGFVFEAQPLSLDYTLENGRRWLAALTIGAEDQLDPADRGVPQSRRLKPQIRFARVPARGLTRLRWQSVAPVRGRYRMANVELITRSPFGLVERRLTQSVPGTLVIYPQVGRLTRKWRQQYRESVETKRGRRHDRTVQEMEYHGLRDYRSGDSPRWIHWRTTARIGQLMVKEFEQQSEQDIAILLDPWLPRTKATAPQREAVELAIRFAATVCIEASRQQGRRVVLGWTGPTPGLCQGSSSVKLLHQMLEALAVMRPVAEGPLSNLIDALPAQTLRSSLLLVVSTRPINLREESERSQKLGGAANRNLAGRMLVFDTSQSDLSDYVEFDATPTGDRRTARLEDAEGDGQATTTPRGPDTPAAATKTRPAGPGPAGDRAGNGRKP